VTVFAASLDVNRGRYLVARARLDELRTAVGGQLGRSQAAGINALDAQLAARSAAEDPVQILDRLFDPAVTLTRYMLDHLDQMGRTAVAIARLSPAAAAKAVDVWTAWANEDPDGTSIRQHLVAISAEHAGQFTDAKSAYAASLEGLPRRAAAIVADAERGMARSCDALGDRVRARQWATTAVSRLASWPGPDRDESVQLLRSLGGRPPQSGGPDARLSDREREVAVLISRGLTNPQGCGLFAVEIAETGIFAGWVRLAVPTFLPGVMPAVETGWRLLEPLREWLGPSSCCSRLDMQCTPVTICGEEVVRCR